MLKKKHAITVFNKHGEQKIPFFFFTDFEGKTFYIKSAEEALKDNVFFQINKNKNFEHQITSQKKLTFEKYPVKYKTYKKAFEKVRKNLKYGNSYLLNLTFATKIETNYSIDEIFAHSNAKYRINFKNKFVVFSPETFISTNENNIFTFPMKGTIDANKPDAHSTILNNPKEIAEHATIVDLLRNDLNMVAKKIKVEKFRYIDKINTNSKNLLQVSSKISGCLPQGWQKNLGQIITKLLPAGSITGAPKNKTVEIIKNIETHKRNFYTGICGFFDGTDLDTGVMIRFIEKIDGKLYYKSGGGITSQSKPESEFQELIDKIYVPIN